MEWYYVLLIFFIHLIGIGFTGSMIMDETHLKDSEVAVMGFFWPVVLPLILGSKIYFLVKKNLKDN